MLAGGEAMQMIRMRGMALWVGRVLCAFLPAAFLSVSNATAADAIHGKDLFVIFAACHADKPDSIGPSLKGVFGRKSAAIEDFRYSNSMKRANLVWDAANLRAYLIDPQAKVKGNRMPFGGVVQPSDADDLVAYLESYK